MPKPVGIQPCFSVSDQLTCECSPYMLCVLVQIDQGMTVVQDFLAMPGAGPAAKSYLTEACLRRLSRLPLSDDDDDAFL